MFVSSSYWLLAASLWSAVKMSASQPVSHPFAFTSYGAPFIEPLECTDLNCTLRLEVYQYRGPYAAFKTRAYNGGIIEENTHIFRDIYEVCVCTHLSLSLPPPLKFIENMNV
jgi:hypothetical protein